MDIDHNRLSDRIGKYFDPNLSHEQMRQMSPGSMESGKGFEAEQTRDHLRKRGILRDNFVRFSYRPFDVRWLYWEPETNLLDRKRADYFPHVFSGNVWFTALQRNRKEFDPPMLVSQLGAYHLVERGANFFPVYLNTNDLLNLGSRVNVSPQALAYTERLGAKSNAIFYHTIAILHAVAYRIENAGALRQDWPRIPLPKTKELLTTSASVGRLVADLLDTEKPVAGVTTGKIRDELRSIGAPERVGGGQLNPDTDFAVRARWGYAGRGGITMPGQGTVVERDISEHEFDGLGSRTVDVYLNSTAYWRNVPLPVWEYTLGGYQVIKKWLSYREIDLLKRPLTLDEVKEVTNIARRIAAILLLGPELDANYAAIKANTVAL